jgi:hypothetical protein
MSVLRYTLVLCPSLALLGCATPQTVPCDSACQDTQRRAAYIAAKPELDKRLKLAITQGKLVPGMSQDDVRAVLGEPDDRVDTVAPWIGREQWIYRAETDLAPSFYYFQFGRLQSWRRDITANN